MVELPKLSARYRGLWSSYFPTHPLSLTMSFLQFSKKICFGTLISFTFATPALADDTDDVLGRFLEQKLAASYTQQNQGDDPLQSLIASNMLPDSSAQGATTIQQQAAFAGPMLNARSALIMNAGTGEILYQKNMDSVRSIASISKLMSAMVLPDARLNMNE